MQSEYLLIGEITRPQGVRGEMRVKPYTDDPMRFEELERAFIKRGDIYEPREVKFVRLATEDVVIIRMEGVGDANAAERLRGEKLYVDRAHAVELPEDADFIVDLIGCRVVDDEGAEYGKITDVMQPGGNDVYVIEGPMGEVLVPALKSVVLSVDTEEGLMRLAAARVREVAVFED
jgi:16S rRNA processing protein RimM